MCRHVGVLGMLDGWIEILIMITGRLVSTSRTTCQYDISAGSSDRSTSSMERATVKLKLRRPGDGANDL